MILGFPPLRVLLHHEVVTETGDFVRALPTCPRREMPVYGGNNESATIAVLLTLLLKPTIATRGEIRAGLADPLLVLKRRLNGEFLEGGLISVRLVLRARYRDLPLTIGHHDRSVLHHVQAERHVFLHDEWSADWRCFSRPDTCQRNPLDLDALRGIPFCIDLSTVVARFPCVP
jgi:hypothetical protein